MDLEKIRTCCESLEQDITALRMTERIEFDFYSAMIDAVQTIAAEITAPPKSNGDRIRQMTDEELAHFMVIQAIMGAISVNGIQDKAAADKIVKEIIMEHEADEDISAALLWLKQEVSKDA